MRENRAKNNLFLTDEGVFNKLHSLIFLDFSHTKLKQESVRALATLGGKVEQLSLCYTEIPLITPGMFSNTNLKVLDLSGNPSLTPNLLPTWFNGLESKLEILIFRNSNLKNIGPLRNLMKLRMLDLGENHHRIILKVNANRFLHCREQQHQSNICIKFREFRRP